MADAPGSGWADRLTSSVDAARSPDFRRFFVGQLLSTVGTWLQTLALGLLVLDLTGSAGALGGITAVQFLPALLLGVGAGTLLDRVDLRRFIIGNAVVAGVLAAGLGIALALGPVPPAAVIAVTFALGTCQALERPAALAFLPRLVDADALPSAIGLHGTTSAAGRLAGPALGGLLYATAGPAVCFMANGASYLVVIATAIAIRPTRSAPAGDPATGRRMVSLAEGFRHAWARPPLREVLVLNAVVGLLGMNFAVTVPAMVQLTFGGDATAVGIAHSLNAVGAVIGGVASAAVLRDTRRGLAVVCALLAASLIALAVAPTLTAFLWASPAFGILLALYQTNSQRIVQRAADPVVLGQMMSLVVLGTVGTTPLGSLLVGWLTDVAGARSGMALGAVGFGLAAAALVVAARVVGPTRPREQQGCTSS
ncbi:MFS transporter [Euzebya sp.]|uniref:MFS transporter n=1 Tax=Euzebya sp. TaxID=1971409 RepID=UPI003510D712